MATKTLTDRGIAALPTPPVGKPQKDYWDESWRGFGVRVSYGGKKVFVVRYRVNGRLRRMTLGPYPALSLADARRKAKLVIGDVVDGGDPAEAKIARREVKTFRELADEYLLMAEKRHKSWSEERRVIEKDLKPVLGPRLLTDIRRRDVRDLVEDILLKRDAPAMANRTLSLMSRIFNHAVDREWMETNPAARIKEPGEEHSRDRVLNDAEIRTLWQALEALATDDDVVVITDIEGNDRPVVRPITRATAEAFQVQLLTAQRPGEVRDMKWAQVDLATGWWTLPGTATKNGSTHRVPLTDTALAILQDRRARAKETAIYVFENREGLGSIRHRGKKAASQLCRVLKFHFRAHDLRRTAASNMAEAGVDRMHIAHVLNHRSVTHSTVTAVYDRYHYDKEKRAALDVWGRRLSEITIANERKILTFSR